MTSLVPSTALYLDLDIAVLRPLDAFVGDGSFVYRWEQFDFANSAVLMRTAEDKSTRPDLLARSVELGTALPWILFRDAECARMGLAVHSTDRYDPLWSPSFPTGPTFEEFFTAAPDAADSAARLTERFAMVHWHNRWKIVPPPDSPYGHLLRWAKEAPARRAAVSPGGADGSPLAGTAAS